MVEEVGTFTVTDCVWWGTFNIQLANNTLVENEDLKRLRTAGYDVVQRQQPASESKEG